MKIQISSAGRAPVSAYLSACAIFLFVLLFAGSAAAPLHLDNVDFPVAAKATAFSGVPICYRGEEAPQVSSLFHPPLYIYLLAGWIRAFGYGEAQVRLFGMVCALLQGAVVLAIIRTLFGYSVARRWSPAFWAIFLLNPYTLQAATITDIDSTIYGPLLCLVILATVKISWREGEWRTDPISSTEYAWVAGALFLCLWSKLTTVLLIFPFLFFLFIPRLKTGRAVLMVATVAIGSVAAFLASYYVYGRLLGLDIGYTFRFTWMSFVQRGSSGGAGFLARLRDHWNNFRYMGPFMLSWTGALPWVAACLAIALAFRSGIRTRNWRLLHYGIVLCLAALSTAYYCAKVMTFGSAPFKYVFVYWGLVLTAPLFLSTYWVRTYDWKWGGWREPAALSGLYAAAALWATLCVRDSLMLNVFSGPYRWVAVTPALLFLAALAAQRYTRPAIMGTAAALTLYCGVQLGIAVFQEKAPYSTTYDYGQTGFLETVAFLKSNTAPDDLIASMKDIGFRSGLRYFETYGALYGDAGAAQRFKAAAASGRFAYIVFTEDRGQDQLVINPLLRQWFLERSTLLRSFGNYRVYRMADRQWR